MNNIDVNLLSREMDSQARERAEEYLKEMGLFPFRIGKSIIGKPINAYTLGKGKKSVLYIASHHALESVCTNILYMLLSTLATAKREGKSERGIHIPSLLNAYRIVVVPCLNPDGIDLRLGLDTDTPLYQRQVRMNGTASFSFWQANARGVDLNHNYDYRFSEYKQLEARKGIDAGRTLFSGEYPESEPESRAVANLVRSLCPGAVLSLHTQGEEIYYMPKGDFRTELIAGRLERVTGYKLVSAAGTAAYGGLCDYTGSLGIPSFTLEVGKGKNPLPSDLAYSLFRRVYPALLLLPTMI